MDEPVVAISHTLLTWLLLLLSLTVSLFGWRCCRAGVIAMFGRYPTNDQALLRLTAAASLPALLSIIWFNLNPELSAWVWLGTAHLAIAWYGLRWLLPDGLNVPPNAGGTGLSGR